MISPVLVAGATGNVGRAVVSALRAAGIGVRAGSPGAADRWDGDVDVVALDVLDSGTFRPALDGVAGLFLLRPPAVTRVGPTLNALLDAAARSGVEHVVFSSVAGADTNRLVPHHRVERHLQASPLQWTILRPGFFAQNLGDAYRTDIRDHDRLHVPAGTGRVAFIDVRDMGDVTARIFADPVAHRGQGYLLTGPRAVTFAEVAAVLTSALRRPVRYDAASAAGYARHLRAQGLPPARIAVQTLLHLGLRRGDAEVVDPTLGAVLERPPRTITDYVSDHAALWSRVAADPSTPPAGGPPPRP